ncbi:dipeptide/oligopeptide/nickel ABC transporter permease/ATP-binding protein [Kutzneria sp. 744]|uniref:dipeptide/oligopeptide/nickel ABC transporter permease/ATP-binding protein n=1 Tax=Kutzneria sp. (strain 744) TaxID=345341 RepID=UPI001E6077D1
MRTPIGVCAGTVLLVVLVLAVLGPIVWSSRASQADVAAMLQGPSSDHWAGTDNLGRDIAARVLVATRLSIELALLATAITVTAGLVLGAAGVLVGRRVARAVSAGVNIAVAFPALLLALFFAVIFGVGAQGGVLAIGLAGAPAFARLTQTLVAGIEQRDFVAAARIAGIGRVRVLVRHILPNIAEALVVNAAIGAGGALLAFAGLSFLGLGVQAPDYDWGRLLGEGLAGIYDQPIAALAPAVAVIIAGLALNLFGEALAKGFGLTTPRLKMGRPTPPPVHGAPAADGAVLDVADLVVTLPGPIQPVRGIDFSVGRGESVGIVGESGSGKSTTALAVARLLAEPARVEATRLSFLGNDLLTGSDRTHRRLLGTGLGVVFQDPMTSLNPTRRVGGQLAEVARQHDGLSRRSALALAVEKLRAVRVPAAERRARQYPHEFSGGMRQRAMIGMGLMGRPALIVADEPTTALDVTVQRQVLDLLGSIQREDGVALLLISHDVAVVQQVCDRVLVMYAGRIVEELPAAELAVGARHPYTRALMAAAPDMDTDRDQPLACIPGRAPGPEELPEGCAFAPRCSRASDVCRQEDPPLESDGPGRRTACWHPVIAPSIVDMETAGQGHE